MQDFKRLLALMQTSMHSYLNLCGNVVRGCGCSKEDESWRISSYTSVWLIRSLFRCSCFSVKCRLSESERAGASTNDYLNWTVLMLCVYLSVFSV